MLAFRKRNISIPTQPHPILNSQFEILNSDILAPGFCILCSPHHFPFPPTPIFSPKSPTTLSNTTYFSNSSNFVVYIRGLTIAFIYEGQLIVLQP
jgi:hypothetical protein